MRWIIILSLNDSLEVIGTDLVNVAKEVKAWLPLLLALTAC